MATNAQAFVKIHGKKIPLSEVTRLNVINGPSTLQLAVAYAYAWPDRDSGRPEQLVAFFDDTGRRTLVRIRGIAAEDGSGDSHIIEGWVRLYDGRMDSHGDKLYKEHPCAGWYNARSRKGYLNVSPGN